MRDADLPAARELWGATEHMGIGSADELPELERFLTKNPGLSQVATIEHGDSTDVVGTVLTGYDGRRAYLYHLAVHRDYRGRGISRRLLDVVVERLEEVGVERCHIMIFTENESGIAAWRHLGWSDRPDIAIMSRDIACSDNELRC
jgi:putative acetyltransferase